MPKWQIKKIDGRRSVDIGTLPAKAVEKQIEAVLQRLACSSLADDEVISASLLSGAEGRPAFLDRVGSDLPNTHEVCGGISTAENIWKPKGPRREKRPADAARLAVRVARISTGEIENTSDADHGKDPTAKALGKKGGAARAASMTPH